MIRKLRGIVQSNIEPKDHEVMWQYKGRLYYYNNGDWELLDTPTPSDIEYESPEDGKTYTLQEILNKLVQEQKDPIVVPQVTISWGDGLYKNYGNGYYIDSSSSQIPEIKTSKPLESTDKIVLYRYLSRTRSKYCRHKEPKEPTYKTRCAKWTICPKVTHLGHERLGTKFDERPFYINIGNCLYNKGIKIAYEDGGKSIARKIIDYFYDNFCEVTHVTGNNEYLFRVYSGSRSIVHTQPNSNIAGYNFTYNRIGLAIVDEHFNLKSNLLRFKIVLDKDGKQTAKLFPIMTESINLKPEDINLEP